MTYDPIFRRAALDALQRIEYQSVRRVARAFGVSHQTIMRWARAAKLPLPAADERWRASVARRDSASTRWPGWEDRRTKARKLRAGGATLQQIREELGYKSIGGPHYATTKTERQS